MNELHLIDNLIIIGLMVSSLAVGVYHAWTGRKGDKEDFLMGGRKMSVLPVCLSYMASFMNPTSILGMPSEVYSKGVSLWFSVIAIIICSVVAAEVFLPIFYKLKLTSVNTYLQERYQSDVLRMVSSLSLSSSYVLWLGVVLFSPSLVLSTTINLSVNACILISGIVVTIYTAIGGLKAVIWTDVLQYVLMIAGLITIVTKGVLNVGSVGDIFSRSIDGGRLNLNFDMDVYTSNNLWVVLIGMSFLWTAYASCDQILIQRTCSLPTIKKAKQVVYFTMPGFMMNITIYSFLGLTMYANYHKCDPVLEGSIDRVDGIVPFFVRQTFGSIPGLTGLFVVCVCSASLSTLSSGLNAIATLIWEDIFAKRLPNIKPMKAVLLTKLIAASVGAICIAVAFVGKEMGTIFEAAMALSGAPLGPLLAVFSMGLLIPCVNSYGAIFGLIAGQILCFVTNIGAVIHKAPPRTLLSSNEHCHNLNETFVLFSNLRNNQIADYSPEGWNRLFHISYFIVPVMGFMTTFLLGISISLLTGGSNVKNIDPILIHSKVRKYMHKSIKPAEVELENFKMKC